MKCLWSKISTCHSSNFASVLVVVHFIVISLLPIQPQAWPTNLLQGSRAGYSRNIRPLHCASKSGEAGLCMFAWDCMKANGTHLDTCIDRFYFGSCCKLKGSVDPPSDGFIGGEITNEIEADIESSIHAPTPGISSVESTIDELVSPGSISNVHVPIIPEVDNIKPDSITESDSFVPESDTSDSDYNSIALVPGIISIPSNEIAPTVDTAHSSGNISESVDNAPVDNIAPESEISDSDIVALVDNTLESNNTVQVSDIILDLNNTVDQSQSTESDSVVISSTNGSSSSTSENNIIQAVDDNSFDNHINSSAIENFDNAINNNISGGSSSSSDSTKPEVISTSPEDSQILAHGNTTDIHNMNTTNLETSPDIMITATESDINVNTEEATTQNIAQSESQSVDTESGDNLNIPTQMSENNDQLHEDNSLVSESESSTLPSSESVTDNQIIIDDEPSFDNDTHVEGNVLPTQNEHTEEQELKPNSSDNAFQSDLSQVSANDEEQSESSTAENVSLTETSELEYTTIVSIDSEDDNKMNISGTESDSALETNPMGEEQGGNNEESSDTDFGLPVVTTIIPDDTDVKTEEPIVKPMEETVSAPENPSNLNKNKEDSSDVTTVSSIQGGLDVEEEIDNDKLETSFGNTTEPPSNNEEEIDNSWNEIEIITTPSTTTSTTTSSSTTTTTTSTVNSTVVDNSSSGLPILFPSETTPTSTKQPNVTTSKPDLTSQDSKEQENELIESLKTANAKDICGNPVYPIGRIVGGYEATYGEWPWQVSLRQWRSVAFLHKCGAALVNENWAITAAHCVEGIEPDQLLLVMGEFDLGTTKEPYGHVERNVQVIAMHPKFEPRTFEFDLALLRFSEPVTFQPNIIPICIPGDDYNFLNETGFVTGWGRLYEDGPLPTVMQKVPVPVIPNKDCENMYERAGYIEHIPHIFICAGYQLGKQDSCEGDSGGPMVINYKNRWRLAGIISWGIGCAVPNQPGVYTRISEFREWINKIIIF